MSAPRSHARDLIPFLAALVLAFMTLPLPPSSGARWGHVIAAAVVALASGGLAILAMNRGWNAWLRALPAYVLFVGVALLRDAEGGAPSGFGMLVLLSLTWLALHADRAQLLVGIFLMATMFAVPIVAVGSPGYPDSEWRRLVLWVTVGWIAASTMQGLVRRTKEQASDADRRARTDPLTGLPNRRELERVLELETQRAATFATPLTVAMVDLDHFKRFNDQHGHGAGDELLADAATAWRSVVRAGDLVARYGGEEFTVVLPACPAHRARELLERLVAATPRDQTCSIGMATWDGQEAVADLVARADACLYEAKRAGRARVVAC